VTSVCLYLQMHQPPRLRRYSVFDTDAHYFDDETNARILRRITSRCYMPVIELLRELAGEFDGRFRFALSITGSLVEQFKRFEPEMIDRLAELASTGCVELLSETYHHSLAFLYSRDEFLEQIDQHRAMLAELFGVRPTTFRNTELVYNNDLAEFVAASTDCRVFLIEAVDALIDRRPPTTAFHPPRRPDLLLLARHYRLSDDITFRFSERSWPQWPLTAEKYADAIAALPGPMCNLYLDIETFGEHQRAETGVFDFLRALPKRALEQRGLRFVTPREAAEEPTERSELDVPHMISWADTERDLSAWVGNAMQSGALADLYKLERPVKQTGDADLLHAWRQLTCSDHFYYMCTKYFGDGAVHKYFNPYESPYDSYINYMNVLDNLRTRIDALKPA